MGRTDVLNQTHFLLKGFAGRLVLKQRLKETLIHELLTGAFDFPLVHVLSVLNDSLLAECLSGLSFRKKNG